MQGLCAQKCAILKPFTKEYTKYFCAHFSQTCLPIRFFEAIKEASKKSLELGYKRGTGAKFGLKMHLVVGRNQKIRNFVLAPGSMSDVSCTEEVLKNFRGTPSSATKGTAQFHWPTGFKVKAYN
jgi:hypothetical protein